MKALKIIAYIILSVCLIYFGKAFLTEYNRVTEQSAARGDAQAALHSALRRGSMLQAEALLL